MTQMDALKTPRISSTKTSRVPQLSLMRCIACIGIVVLHTVFAASQYFAGSITPMQNMFSRMVDNNMMWAVPVFLMVTGALQLDPGKELPLKKLYGRYLLRILVALVACCIIFRIFDMIMDGEGFTVAGVLQAFTELVTSRCWGHLWYLYLLIGLYLMLPFYRMIAAKASDRELLYLCGIYGLFVSILPMLEGCGIYLGFYISDTIIYPLYLFLGYMIQKGRLRIGFRTGLLLLILSTIVILAMDFMKYGKGMEIPGDFFGYASPAVIIQSVGAFAVMNGFRCESAISRSTLVRQLDLCSFGIYLIHMVFIRLLFRYMEVNPYTYLPAITLPAIILGIILVSFGIIWVLRKIPGVRWVL